MSMPCCISDPIETAQSRGDDAYSAAQAQRQVPTMAAEPRHGGRKRRQRPPEAPQAKYIHKVVDVPPVTLEMKDKKNGDSASSTHRPGSTNT